MATCDICNAEMELAETTAFSIDDLQSLLQHGFGPPDKVVRMAMSAGWTREQVIARWQQELDARPKPYWMFCPLCAKRANKHMPAEELFAARHPAPEEEPAPEAPAAGVSRIKPIAEEEPAAEAAEEAPEPEEEPEEEEEEELQPAGKRPGAGRALFIGLLIGLLGGGALYLLVLDRVLHPITPTPVPTVAVLPTPVPTSPTRVPPTRRPATPRPTEILYPPTAIPVPDLSGVALTLDDMPAGFREMPDSRQETLGLTEEALASAFDLEQGRLRQFGAQDYRTSGELVVSFLVYPLTPTEQESFDQGLSHAAAGLAPLWATLAEHGWGTPTRVAALDPYGESGQWLTSAGSGDADGLTLEVFAARRGPVLEFILVGYLDASDFEVDPLALIERLDGRLAALVPPPRVPGATARPTPAPPPGLANASVRSTDLPAGFAALTESQLAEFGVEFLEETFFVEAQPQNVAMFYDPTADTAIILLSWMSYPLTEMEAGAMRKSYASMTPAAGADLLGLTANQWRSARMLEGLEEVGDGAVGLSGVDASERPNMRMEIVLISRGRAWAVIMLGYVEGTNPRVDIVQVAKAVDARLKAALP